MSRKDNKEEDDDDIPLPGFRFHPTDEELVGFYLRRKVDKKPITLQLIQQADIYKYDPWDLPKRSSSGGDKEWYFFCKRGRKYKNSIRPNRVTGSGFWKATGIDKPIYSEGRQCIGLKKSLVYYRGSAGKGTKTEWMMHEFRLPPTQHQEPAAEVWTLCRILKRNISYRRVAPDWRSVGAANNTNVVAPIMNDHPTLSETCSMESCDNYKSNYISFSAIQNDQKKQLYYGGLSATPSLDPSAPASYVYADINELLRHAEWEDLQAIVGCAAVPPTVAANPFFL